MRRAWALAVVAACSFAPGAAFVFQDAPTNTRPDGSGSNVPHCTGSGWAMSGSAYYAYGTGGDWFTAKTGCEAIGGHLVKVSDATIGALVKAYAGTSSLWIGLYGAGAGSGSGWTWTDATPLGGYRPWNTGQPSGSGCVFEATNGLWYTEACEFSPQSWPGMCQCP